MAEHNQLGVWGENLACEMLVAKGYSIIGRNVIIGNIEVDILAEHDGRIIVVEVKTRRDTQSDPSFAIDRQKVMRLARAVQTYVRSNRLPHEAQIDLVFIIGTPETGHTIEHIADAFYPPRCR